MPRINLTVHPPIWETRNWGRWKLDIHPLCQLPIAHPLYATKVFDNVRLEFFCRDEFHSLNCRHARLSFVVVQTPAAYTATETLYPLAPTFSCNIKNVFIIAFHCASGQLTMIQTVYWYTLYSKRMYLKMYIWKRYIYGKDAACTGQCQKFH